MVDVADKEATRRTAVAEGEVRMRAGTLEAIEAGDVAKGDVHAVTRIAAIQGAKQAANLIPLCHPLPLDRVETELVATDSPTGYRLRVTASATWKTGVEMEALAGVAAGLLALYDMCKSIDRGMSLGPIRLVEKRGGRSGHWRANGGRG